MSQPLVSVIIPTKNSSRTLQAALDSISAQTYPQIELIVVDNSSSDDTQSIVRDFAERVPFPVELLVGDYENTPHTRISGAELSGGDYIFHVDSDMELGDKIVEECVKTIQEGHGAIIIPERSFGEGYWTACKCLERSCYDNDDDVEAARFFPREVYFDVGGHNRKVLFAEDKDLDLRVRKAGHTVGRIQTLIMHNEGRVRLFNLLRKKYGYAKSGLQYLKAHPKNLVRQSIIFRPAYLRNWKKFLKKPHLTVGFVFMRCCEFGVMGISALLNGVRKTSS